MEAVRGCSHLFLDHNNLIIMIGSLRQLVYSTPTITAVYWVIMLTGSVNHGPAWPTPNALQTPDITTSHIPAYSPVADRTTLR